MERTKVAIMNALNGEKEDHEPIWEIIDKRWELQLDRPLHALRAAGHFLNPQIYYKCQSDGEDLNPDKEVMYWLLNCIKRLLPKVEDQDRITMELSSYKEATGLFGNPLAVRQRDMRAPVSEASVSRNRSTIIVPAGSSGEEGWIAFKNILEEILLTSQQQHMEPPDRLPGLSDDVGAGFISSHSALASSGSELNVDGFVEPFSQDEMGNLSKVIRADQKRFFFDLGSNNRGHFLRISEVAGPDRSSIILPLSGLKQFQEMIGHFVEITKDRPEGVAGLNVRTVESSQK